MMHSVLAAIQPIVFVYNVKVRHVLCNMYMYAVIKTIIFLYYIGRINSRPIYTVENDQNLIIV